MIFQGRRVKGKGRETSPGDSQVLRSRKLVHMLRRCGGLSRKGAGKLGPFLLLSWRPVARNIYPSLCLL